MATIPKPITLEEFLRLPEKKPALEFEGGRVTQKVSPKAKHSGLQGGLTRLINNFTQPRRLALAFPELRGTFGGHSYVPDVSVFGWERIPLDTNGEPVDDVFDPPDIAIEILSPGQSAAAGLRRCQWYAENGVRLAPLVDPGTRAISRVTPGTDPVHLTGDNAVGFDGVLPGFELTVDEVFATLKLR